MKVKDSNQGLQHISETLSINNKSNYNNHYSNNNSHRNLIPPACVDRNNPNFRRPQRVVKKQKRSMKDALKLMGLGALGGTAIALTIATGTVFTVSRVKAHVELKQYGEPVRTQIADARVGFTNQYYLVDGQEVLKDDLLDDLTMENFREIISNSKERGK